MTSFLQSALHSWASIAQEPGAEPGTGLKLWQTVTIFLLAPIGLFGVNSRKRCIWQVAKQNLCS